MARDPTGRLARACAGRPWRTLAIWGVVLVLSIGAIGGLLGDALTTDSEMTNDPESYRAYDADRGALPAERRRRARARRRPLDDGAA